MSRVIRLHLVSVKLPKAYVKGLDTLVDRGTYWLIEEPIQRAVKQYVWLFATYLNGNSGFQAPPSLCFERLKINSPYSSISVHASLG